MVAAVLSFIIMASGTGIRPCIYVNKPDFALYPFTLLISSILIYDNLRFF